MDDQRTDREGGGIVGIPASAFGVIGIIMMIAGFLPGYGLLIIAGSILTGSALIASELAKK
jgi:hypothetical protein